MRLALHRFCLAVMVGMFGCVALLNASSLSYQLVKHGGIAASCAFAVLLVLVFLAIVDAVVNDFLPDRIRWRCGIKWRRSIWLWMAVTLAGLGFAVTRYHIDTWLAGFYSWLAIWCAAVAFVDLYVAHAAEIGGRRAGDRRPGCKA